MPVGVPYLVRVSRYCAMPGYTPPYHHARYRYQHDARRQSRDRKVLTRLEREMMQSPRLTLLLEEGPRGGGFPSLINYF